jgi:hypothetical protein
MTYDQFLMLASVCMLLLFGYLIYRLANEKPSKASPRRLKGKSSSGAGIDTIAPMAAADCGGTSDCGGD